jgi:hypothetical protein
LVLEPIFEADLPAEQYAYREGKSALAAAQEVHRLACFGYSKVVDADLSGYFDSIPHAELMQCLARRVSDKAVLHLVKLWLDASVEETDERGHTQRTTRNKDEGRGTPQGAPLSPLLANLYMRRFVLGWKQLGYEAQFRAKIVNYADDFVILCRGSAEQAMDAMRNMMQRLKLTVNEAKTRICKLPTESFDVLVLATTADGAQHQTVEEGDSAPESQDQPDHRPQPDSAGRGDRRWGIKQQAQGLGGILLPRSCQPGLPQRRSTRREPTPPMVRRQAQTWWTAT